MPATKLHPATSQILSAFARRWRTLIVLRAASAMIAVLLAVMLATALLDRFVLLPEWIRIGLAVLGYAAAFLVLIRGLAPLARHRGLPGASRLFAASQPWLGDDVISAVGLAGASGDPRWDSPTFREMAQARTAEKLAHVNVPSLLPWKLARGLLLAALIVVSVTASLCLVPGLSFRTSLARAFLPLSDIARITRNTIALITPANPDAPVPQGDPVEVVVRVGGPRVDRVELSIKTGTSARRAIAMQRDAETGDYRASVAVGREPVAFRVRAGDAASREYRLDARPRPEIVRFDKTYDFPAYTRQPRLQVSQEHGDLTAIEGTDVSLTLTADQPVSHASLRITRDGKSEELPLAPDAKDPRRLAGAIPMSANGRYEVMLVSRDTGFENQFRAQYEITAQPDLRPTAQIDEPTGVLSVAPDGVVNIKGLARDDVGLASVSLSRVGRESTDALSILWKDDGGTPTRQRAVAARVNVADLKLKVGEETSLRLDAIDLKGSAGQSEPLIVRVIDAAMAEAGNEAAPLADTLGELAAAVSEQEAKVRALTETAGNEQKFAEDAAATNKAQAELDQKIESALDDLRAEADRHDLSTADGREAARDADDARSMIDQPAERARDALAQGTSAKSPEDRQAKLADAAARQNQLADALRQAAEHYQKAAEGDAETTRAALRASEEPLGVKAPFDAQYGLVEKLAAMSRMHDDELRKALADELGENAAMRGELAKLTNDAAAQAQSKLEQAAAAEKKLGEDLGSKSPPAPAAAQAGQQDINETAKSAGEDLARAAANAEKLANKSPSQAPAAAALKTAAAKTDAIGKNELAAAQTAVQNQPAAQAQSSVRKAEAALRAQAAAAKAATAAQAAAAAQAEASKQNQSPSQGTGPAGPPPASAAAQPAEEASKWMAAAIDQAGRTNAPSSADNSLAGASENPPGTSADSGESASLGGSEAGDSSGESTPSETPGALSSASPPGTGTPQSTGPNGAPPPGVPGNVPGTMSGTGAPMGQPGPASAMQAAFEAQAQAMRDSRATMGGPAQSGIARGHGPANGDHNPTDPGSAEGLPGVAQAKTSTWGQLTPQRARDLAAAKHDQIAPEYRADVDAYFRAVAERANQGRNP